MKVVIETANAAFADGNKGHEIARILREVADKLDVHPGLDEDDDEEYHITLFDLNGNPVGKVTGS